MMKEQDVIERIMNVVNRNANMNHDESSMLGIELIIPNCNFLAEVLNWMPCAMKYPHTIDERDPIMVGYLVQYSTSTQVDIAANDISAIYKGCFAKHY